MCPGCIQVKESSPQAILAEDLLLLMPLVLLSLPHGLFLLLISMLLFVPACGNDWHEGSKQRRQAGVGRYELLAAMVWHVMCVSVHVTCNTRRVLRHI
jgi:hypothetical protein